MDKTPFCYVVCTDVLKAIGVIVAAVWAWWVYTNEKEKDRRAQEAEKAKERDAKTKDSAERLHQLFNGFYLNQAFCELRLALDFQYKTKLDPFIKIMVDLPLEADSPLKDEQNKLLCNLDTLLKYLEFILHLNKHGQLLDADCNVLFDYWFEQLEKDDRVHLQKYIGLFGFKYVYERIVADRAAKGKTTP